MRYGNAITRTFFFFFFRGRFADRLFGAPGGPGSQFSRGPSFNGGAFDHHRSSGEAFGAASPSPYRPKFSKQQQQQPQHYRVREENSAELAARFAEDDGSSAYDGAGDYSSHSPFRAPSAPVHGYGKAADDGSGGGFNSDEQQQQPHSFGSGYAFEFGGANNGASVEF